MACAAAYPCAAARPYSRRTSHLILQPAKPFRDQNAEECLCLSVPLRRRKPAQTSRLHLVLRPAKPLHVHNAEVVYCAAASRPAPREVAAPPPRPSARHARLRAYVRGAAAHLHNPAPHRAQLASVPPSRPAVLQRSSSALPVSLR
eukprot:6758874-Prymnesium_polylepis.1